MKEINILGVTLTVTTKAKLPTFLKAGQAQQERYPYVFSIQKEEALGPDWYTIQVSPSAILEAMVSVQALAAAQAAANLDFQILKEKAQ